MSPSPAGSAIDGVERWPVLDSWVDGFTRDSLLELIRVSVRVPGKTLIANHNVNSLALLERDELFRHFYRDAHHIFIDGAPVVGLAKLSGAPATMANRVAVLDWIWPFFALAEEQGWRVTHLGGRTEIAQRAARRIRRRHPSVSLTCVDGYFDADDPVQNGAIVRTVGASRPHVLLVGMGMPRQELWVHRNLHRLPPCVVLTVGGAFGYLGGDRPTAPRWLGPLWLEWLFRLGTEPRRLWQRYLLEAPVLARPVGRQCVRAALDRVRSRKAARDGARG
jgi:N-acetylglucosaminyldiphosphoundecaprenol N-acetyl-beta-D-mannosaminyltransferase